MRPHISFIIAVFSASALTLSAVAGPEALPSGKEMKQVAPPPPSLCDWSGLYIGLHAGGQFGHSEDLDHDYNVGFSGGANVTPPDKPWGYSESGVVAGGQIGYNWQWHWLVAGPEVDVGYMNLDGDGIEPGSPHEAGAPNGDTTGKSDSDFYATFRARIGVALDWSGCWLVYATGGAIGVNYDTRVEDPFTPVTLDAHKKEFNWGYTIGGGIERQIGRHWSIKAEYLYFSLSDQTFSGTSSNGFNVGFNGESAGHIVRGGLNFRF